jgi:hypothetical protein
MFIFGHVGIGRKLVHPWSRRLPAVALIAGMLLPDLIDKPLYYARISDFFSCTRTVGHTGLFLMTILAIAYFARSSGLGALGAGVATHLALDMFLDLFGRDPQRAAWIAFTWPFLNRNFAYAFIPSITSHLERLWATPVIAAEVVGLALIAWDYWRWRQRSSQVRD